MNCIGTPRTWYYSTEYCMIFHTVPEYGTEHRTPTPSTMDQDVVIRGDQSQFQVTVSPQQGMLFRT